MSPKISLLVWPENESEKKMNVRKKFVAYSAVWKILLLIRLHIKKIHSPCEAVEAL